MLKLTPKKPSAQYKTLYLVADPTQFRVKESVIIDASNNVNHFQFYAPDFEKPIDATEDVRVRREERAELSDRRRRRAAEAPRRAARSRHLHPPRRARSDKLSRRSSANGLEIAYLEQGTGPLVVLLHGFPDTAHTWEPTMAALAAAGFRAVAPFMRGYFPTDDSRRRRVRHRTRSAAMRSR